MTWLDKRKNKAKESFQATSDLATDTEAPILFWGRRRAMPDSCSHHSLPGQELGEEETPSPSAPIVVIVNRSPLIHKQRRRVRLCFATVERQ